MKKILMGLPVVIISIVSFVTVSLIDIILISVALLNRAVRSVFIWLISTFNTEMDSTDMREGVNTLTNTGVNYAYKHYIDLMYPVEEDSEEYFED